jgi:hypothetical protein
MSEEGQFIKVSAEWNLLVDSDILLTALRTSQLSYFLVDWFVS